MDTDFQKYFKTKSDKKFEEMKKNLPQLIQAAQQKIRDIGLLNPELHYKMRTAQIANLGKGRGPTPEKKLKKKAKWPWERQSNVNKTGVRVGLGTHPEKNKEEY